MQRPRLVAFTGAGISAESGLRTFRDGDGLWEEYRIEDVATPEAWQRDPKLVLSFYDERRDQVLKAAPNAAHEALARLEEVFDVSIVTQNIDDLHERAGSQNLIHMHGELLKVRCDACHAVHAWREDLATVTPCPHCGHVGAMRPHVVWFGEMPLEMERIYQALADCALFMSIGTSGNVYPAAGFVHAVLDQGDGRTVELNLEPSQGASLFEEQVYGPATAVVPAYVERLLKDGIG